MWNMLNQEDCDECGRLKKSEFSERGKYFLKAYIGFLFFWTGVVIFLSGISRSYIDWGTIWCGRSLLVLHFAY